MTTKLNMFVQYSCL